MNINGWNFRTQRVQIFIAHKVAKAYTTPVGVEQTLHYYTLTLDPFGIKKPLISRFMATHRTILLKLKY